MQEFMSSIINWQHWDFLLSVLVIVHLISEYGHYIWEFVSGQRETNILKDIQTHRRKSTKTTRLISIQTDIALIKEKLNIHE